MGRRGNDASADEPACRACSPAAFARSEARLTPATVVGFAAFAAASGLAVTLESFGLVGYGFHPSEDECIDLGSIEPRVYLLTRPVMDSARGR